MPTQLAKRKILITGASRGIGAHIATGLARAGADLVLSSTNIDNLAETAAACQAHGGSVATVAADLMTSEGRARLIEAAGEIDILINNAGVEHAMALVDQSQAQVHAQLETNLIAPIDLSRRVLPMMIARRSGTIVNVSSMSGKGATPYNSVYAATKYGLNGFTASLRIELLDTGVHAGVVCPSFVAGSGMWADTGLKAPRAMREVSPDQVVHAVLAVIGGAREVLVTPGPIRPLLALRELFPALEVPVLRRMGILKTLAARADVIKTRDPSA